MNVRGWSAQGRVAVRQVRPGTLRPEWQCDGCARVRSEPSGSADHTAKWRRAYRSGTLRPEWQCDGYARGRVAVRQVRPGTLGAEWQCGSHCHLPVNVRRLNAQCRVAVRWVRSGPSGSAMGTLGAEWQCGSHCHLPVNVRRLNAQGRVAVRLVRSGSSGSVDPGRLWTCGHCTDVGTVPRAARPSFTDQDSLLANQADR